jgi:tRNA(fMet)-specific endonuclease VapC
LLKKLRNLPKALQYSSAISIGEIYFGACRTSKKRRILKAFEEKVFPNITILPFDEESGRIFGELKARLQKKGIGCSEPDLRIAAITLQHRLTLITGNINHFKVIPDLEPENWLV